MAQESTQNILQSLSLQLASVVEQVAPSVVRVDDGSRLTATGIIWSEDGVILTTSHGVERDDDISIELADGTQHDATLLGRDPDTDLAALRVDTSGLSAVKRARPEEARVGNLVLALGRPGAAGLQATIGIISAHLESQHEGQDEHILHTDAVLYPGFSGGPLVDVTGAVVGMTNRGFGHGIGVALGIPVLEHVCDALLSHGWVRRGYLGVGTQAVELPSALRKSLGLSQDRGLMIAGVQSGSPAEAGGLLLGDVLLSVNGVATHDAEELRRRLRNLRSGQSVSLQIVRAGTLQELSVVLGADE
jgi:S1-C subfamily serine protease